MRTTEKLNVFLFGSLAFRPIEKHSRLDTHYFGWLPRRSTSQVLTAMIDFRSQLHNRQLRNCSSKIVDKVDVLVLTFEVNYIQS